MRNDLLHKITEKLVNKEKMKQVKAEGNGDYRILLKIKGVKRE